MHHGKVTEFRIWTRFQGIVPTLKLAYSVLKKGMKIQDIINKKLNLPWWLKFILTSENRGPYEIVGGSICYMRRANNMYVWWTSSAMNVCRLVSEKEFRKDLLLLTLRDYKYLSIIGTVSLWHTCGMEQMSAVIQAMASMIFPRRRASFTFSGCSTAK